MKTDPRAPGVVIPDDLTPWPGGDAAPADHDGEGVLMADGRWGYGNDLPGTWSAAGHALSKRGPIIAYRSAPSTPPVDVARVALGLALVALAVA